MKNKSTKPPQSTEKEERKLEIAKGYADLVKQHNLFPTRSDLLEIGVSRDQVRHHFGNISRLRKEAKALFPETFKGVLDVSELTSPKYLSQLEKVLNKHKRFVVTTAVNGQQVHKGFLKSIEKYCKENDAALLLIPCHDPAHNLDNEIEWHFDKNLVDYHWVFEKLAFNSNIHISSIRVTAKQINPTTGLGRFVQGQGSAIFGSPKQSLEFIPVSNIKYPHALMSTGAITMPNYKTTKGNSLRTAFIAEHDHVIGGLIIEVQDDKLYHFRQIQADENGAFADLGLLYDGNKISEFAPEAIKLGDYHAGDHDENAVRAWLELADVTKAKKVIMEDLFNGKSVNHHEQHNIVNLAKLAFKGELNLVRELDLTGAVLNKWTGKGISVVVTKSNHDEFLDRWVNQARFSKDPYNFQAGCRLADKMVDGHDPLVIGLDFYGHLKNKDKIRFLNRDEDYKIAGIECGAHGDLGPNGSKGTKASLERAYGKAVIAHSHTPGILRGIFQVGTTSLLKLDYNRGPSSWIHCSCLIYGNGQRQLIVAIDGNWRLRDNKRRKAG